MVAQIMKRSKNARYYSANPTTPAARPQIMTKSFAIAISKNNPPPHVGAVVYECEISECPPPHRAPRKHSLRGWFWAGGGGRQTVGGWGTMTTPSTTSTPLRRGELGFRPVAESVPLHWRGAPTPGPARRVAWVVRAGWLESSRICTYSPLSSRAKRGDPVNKKALRAYRPQTLSTL